MSVITSSLKNTLLPCALCCSVMLLVSACRTGAAPDTPQDESASLTAALLKKDDMVSLPAGWRVLDESKTQDLYQAQAQSANGNTKVLIGRFKLEEDAKRDTGYYLSSLHYSLVNRLRGEAGVEPYIEDQVQWTNGIQGLRTLLRGELPGRGAVIIEGLTFVDDDQAYFLYGLFPESAYLASKREYESILASIKPLQNAQIRSDNAVAGYIPVEQPATPAPTTPAPTSDGSQPEQPAAAPTEPIKPAYLTLSVFPDPAQQIGGVSWGQTQEITTDIKGKPANASSKVLNYLAEFNGFTGVMVYLFTFNKLTSGTFVFQSKYDAGEQYLNEFIEIDKSLSQTYGAPVQRATIWSNERFKSNQSRWGDALDQGDVVFGSVWKFGNVKVIHSLKSDGLGGIRHLVVYKSSQT